MKAVKSKREFIRHALDLPAHPGTVANEDLYRDSLPKMEWDKKVNCYWVGGELDSNHTFNASIYCNIERSYDS